MFLRLRLQSNTDHVIAWGRDHGQFWPHHLWSNHVWPNELWPELVFQCFGPISVFGECWDCPGPPGLHTTTRELQTISGPQRFKHHQNSGEGKKREILPPTLRDRRAPQFGAPCFWVQGPFFEALPPEPAPPPDHVNSNMVLAKLGLAKVGNARGREGRGGRRAKIDFFLGGVRRGSESRPSSERRGQPHSWPKRFALCPPSNSLWPSLFAPTSMVLDIVAGQKRGRLQIGQNSLWGQTGHL